MRDYRSYCLLCGCSLCSLELQSARASVFFFEGVAFNIITLQGLVGIYTIKLSVKRGKDKGGGLMERHRARANTVYSVVHDGREVWNEEGRAGWQQSPFAGSLTSCVHTTRFFYLFFLFLKKYFFFYLSTKRMSDVGCTPGNILPSLLSASCKHFTRHSASRYLSPLSVRAD